MHCLWLPALVLSDECCCCYCFGFTGWFVIFQPPVVFEGPSSKVRSLGVLLPAQLGVFMCAPDGWRLTIFIAGFSECGFCGVVAQSEV